MTSKKNTFTLAVLVIAAAATAGSQAQASEYAVGSPDAVRARHNAGSTYVMAGGAVRERHSAGIGADAQSKQTESSRSETVLDLNEGF